MDKRWDDLIEAIHLAAYTDQVEPALELAAELRKDYEDVHLSGP